MLTDAFEEAFYQLDLDRDGVVTIRDLERYSKERNLKDSFIQKWLGLFGDEKNTIYYDKFCSTLGIIPSSEKFQIKILKVDMTEETQKSIINFVMNLQEKNQNLSENTLEEIKEQIQNEIGGQWNIKLNPDQSELDVKHDNDGLLYFNPNTSNDSNILLWRIKEKFVPLIFQEDMTDNTKNSVIEIIAKHQDKDKNLSLNTLDNIKTEISKHHGGQWEISVDPHVDDLQVEYDEDGVLYYCPDDKENKKILVWKMTSIKENEPDYKIHKIDMTDETQKSIINIIADFQNKNQDLSPESLNEILKEISNKNKGQWDMKLNPSDDDIEVKYDNDGILYYAPIESEDLNILVWRVPENQFESDVKPVIYKCEMSEALKNYTINSFYKNSNDGDKMVIKDDIIKEDLNEAYGKTWSMLINPTEKQLKVDHGFEGMIYFATNPDEDTKIFIWRQDLKKKGSLCCCGCF